MAENGIKFSLSLHQMHDDLSECVANVDKARKVWKSNGLTAEQRHVDTESAMHKAKNKYVSIAEDYDRARTGDGTKRVFGLKGPKSMEQREEELLRKVQAADGDYAQKVQTAQSSRAELLSRGRPEAVKNLLDLIKECDSALSLQMQKYCRLPLLIMISLLTRQLPSTRDYCFRMDLQSVLSVVRTVPLVVEA